MFIIAYFLLYCPPYPVLQILFLGAATENYLFRVISLPLLKN